jgi:hypothetical protein
MLWLPSITSLQLRQKSGKRKVHRWTLTDPVLVRPEDPFQGEIRRRGQGCDELRQGYKACGNSMRRSPEISIDDLRIPLRCDRHNPHGAEACKEQPDKARQGISPSVRAGSSVSALRPLTCLVLSAVVHEVLTTHHTAAQCASNDMVFIPGLTWNPERDTGYRLSPA